MSDLVITGVSSGLKIRYDNDVSSTDQLPLPPNPNTPLPVIGITGSGDMLKSVYDKDDNGVVDTVDSVPISAVENLQPTLDYLEQQSQGKYELLLEAGQDISALRILYQSGSKCYYLDPTNDNQVLGLIGLSISSASTGEIVRIQQQSSPLTDSSQNQSKGLVFVGPNGTLTQQYPESGQEIVVGFSPSPTTINITFDEPIKL